ncbi:MAG: MarR family transcriptional regulator [Halobacteriales archaeon]|nr:MarR family transcriptional regulator [Halobacteriales archaeon]
MDPTVKGADTTLESIEFLARSKNRVTVLEALADGPMQRYEIEASTGVSRPTLSRILEDFTERGWVRSSDHRYELTHLGAFVTTEFTAFHDRMRISRRLADIVKWFPDESFDFDLACLNSAEVIRAHKTDTSAPTTHIVRRLEAADRVRIITYTILPEAFRVCGEKTVEGDLELEVVFDPETVATLAADPRNIEQATEMIDTGRVALYASEDPIPYVLVIPDDEGVLIYLTGPDGVTRAVIDSDDEVVRSWAMDEFEVYRSKANPLEPSHFAT